MFRSVLKEVVRRLPNQVLEYVLGSGVVMPLYHTVADQRLPHVCNIMKYRDVDAFCNDIDFLDRSYRLASGEEVGRIATRGKNGERRCVITFDDGYREVYDCVAPILDDKNVGAVFFVCSDFVDNKNMFYRNKASLLVEFISTRDVDYRRRRRAGGVLGLDDYSSDALCNEINSLGYDDSCKLDRIAEMIGLNFGGFLQDFEPYLTTAQIQELQGHGFIIGAHSVDHPYYPSLDLDDQLSQTENSVAFLKECLPVEAVPFAFPFNDLGVHRQFFEELDRRNITGSTFGTCGACSIYGDEGFGHYHRVAMEQEPGSKRLSAYEIFNSHYSNKMIGMLSKL